MSLTSINVNNALVTSVDSEPTIGSDNLVKSGGVFSSISEETERAKAAEEALTVKLNIPHTYGYYWSDLNNDNIIDGVNTYNNLIRINKIKVNAGEKYYIRTYGQAKGYSYFITDENYNLIESSDGDKLVNEVITIPEGSYYLLLNCCLDYIDNFIFEDLNNASLSGGLYKLAQEESVRSRKETARIYAIINSILDKNSIFYISLTWMPGYIDYKDGTYHNYSLGTTSDYRAITEYIEINKGYKYITTATFLALAGIAFYDSEKTYISGYNDNYEDGAIIIPDEAVYFRLSNYKETTAEDAIVSYEIPSILINTIQDLLKKVGTTLNSIPLTWVTGYIDYEDGAYHYYSSGTTPDYRAITEYIKIEDDYKYITTATFHALAGIAFYDSEKTYISGYNDNYEDGVIVIPEGTVYFRLSNYKETTAEDAIVSQYKEGQLDREIEDLDKKIKTQNIVISCIGDSVTEGMATDGAHSSIYGKAPYPAQLYTLLVDNGYSNVSVNNYGHGGERLQDVAVRTGAIGCYINETITIPADNSRVSLGVYTLDNGRIKGTKLSLYQKDQYGDDYNVYLTQTSHDTNPCTIDGIKYNMTISENQNYIQKVTADNKETVIPAGTLFFTNNNVNSDVNIIYIGINGSSSITLEQWLAINKACGISNGGKYIILGCTHSIWTNWSDVEGNNVSEKHLFYARKCFETFGNHFIDLYDDFSRHAMEYCLEKGYFSDKTEDEINNMKQLLESHIIPAEFSYNYNSQGDVHLSKEGYYVIGKLLFDRLKLLNYI